MVHPLFNNVAMVFGPRDDKADVHILRGEEESPYIIQNVKLDDIVSVTNKYKEACSEDRKHLYPKYKEASIVNMFTDDYRNSIAPYHQPFVEKDDSG